MAHQAGGKPKLSGTWTVTVRNTGTSASTGTTKIVFESPGETVTGQFLTSSGTGWTCHGNGPEIRICVSPAAVPPGGSLPPISFPWSALAGYGYANATAVLTNPSDGTTANNTLSITTPVVPDTAVNLSMSLSDGGGPFMAHQAGGKPKLSGTWTVTVRNTGTSASTGTTKIVFESPGETVTGQFLTSSGTGWTCHGNGPEIRICVSPAAVPPGGSLPPISFPWSALPGYGYANATAVLTNPSDGTTANNTLSITTPVVPDTAVNLSMSLSDGGGPFMAHQAGGKPKLSGTWTVTVRNTGTSASTGTTKIVFESPGETVTGQFLTSSGTGWTCHGNGPEIRICVNPAAVPPGGSLPPISFPWSALAGYGYANATAVLTNPSDGTTANNTLSITTPVVQPSSTVDVVASLSDGGAPFTAGQPGVYTITVRNVGTSAATGTTTVDYPAPLGGEVAAGSGWICTGSGVSTPHCTYPGGIPAGSALPPITVTVPVPAQDDPGYAYAAASVDNPSDGYTSDNNAQLDTPITPLPVDVVASLSDGGTPFAGGQPWVYTITVRNTGTSAATGTTTVDYPAPLGGEVAAGSGWICTGSGVSTPHCTYPGGIPAGSALPAITVTIPVQLEPAPDYTTGYLAGVGSVNNASDAFTNDNQAFLDTGISAFPSNVEYVAFGDSYSSGEGVPTQDGAFIPPTNTPGDKCHRSYYAYSQDVAGTKGFPPASETAFWACSGAIIADYTHRNADKNEPSQQSHLLTSGGVPNAAIKLISLTMGGNDVEFPYVMISCLAIPNCQDTENPIVTALINHTEPRLRQLYQEILHDAPNAQVFVLGYPAILDTKPSADCQAHGIQPGEAKWIDSKAAELDTAISDAVTQAGDPSRLHYVSTLNAFAGGQACSISGSTNGPYMNGVILKPDYHYSFHPNQAGQEILASVLAHAVRHEAQAR